MEGQCPEEPESLKGKGQLQGGEEKLLGGGFRD